MKGTIIQFLIWNIIVIQNDFFVTFQFLICYNQIRAKKRKKNSRTKNKTKQNNKQWKQQQQQQQQQQQN